MDAIERLIQVKNEAVKRARDIRELAITENRELTAEETANEQAAFAEVDRCNEHLQQIEALNARAALAADVRRTIIPDGTPEVPDTDPKHDLRAMLRGETPYFEERINTTFGAMGITVPQVWSPRFTTYLRTLNPVWQVANVTVVPSGSPMVFPALTTDLTSYTPGESTAITLADPTIGAATATFVGYKALTQLSQEWESDSRYPVETIIQNDAGRSIAMASGVAFTTTSNIGFIALGTNGGTAGGLGGGSTATFFGLDDLITLKYSLALPYRGSGTWMASNSAIQKMRKFRDLNGDYLWGPSTISGQPDTFDGHPVLENPAMAAVASASKSVAFGDFSAYQVLHMPIRVERSTDYAFNTDLITVKTVLRAAGTLPDAAAIAYLVSANS